jgi:hypothetical protein
MGAEKFIEWVMAHSSTSIFNRKLRYTFVSWRAIRAKAKRLPAGTVTWGKVEKAPALQVGETIVYKNSMDECATVTQ